MNKPIFKKIKKHLNTSESLTNSPSSSYPYQTNNIVNMSIQDIQKTLLIQMNNDNRSYSPSDQVQVSYPNNNEINKSLIEQSKKSMKNLPQLMLENDELKEQIQRLKGQRKMIISKYQQEVNIVMPQSVKDEVNSSGNNKQKQKNTTEMIGKKSEQFSFRKSLENIQKSSSNHYNPTKSSHKSSHRQNNMIFTQQHRPINKRSLNSMDGKMDGKSNANYYNLKKSLDETYSTLQERFYQYCKNEMIRMNSENMKLTMKLGELQNKLTEIYKDNEYLNEQNKRLREMSLEMEEKFKTQTEIITKLNQEVNQTMSKKEEIFKVQMKRNQMRLGQLMEMEKKHVLSLEQKQREIIKLRQELIIRPKKCEKCAETLQYNNYLQNELNQQLFRNKKLHQKQKFIKTSAIDHLWEIKEIEYSNLVEIIRKEKQGILSSSKPTQYEQMEISFSKDFK